MTFELDMPEDVGSESNFLTKAGTFHCVVTQLLDGTGPKGKLIEGFSVGLDVLEGTVREGGRCTEIGKTANLTLFNPKLTSKDGGNFARKKQASFAIATNLVDPSLRGQRVSIDLTKAVGEQVVVKFELSSGSDGKEYVDLSYADIWHIDDPRGEAVPKNEKAVALIPKEKRRDRAFFDFLDKKGKAATTATTANSSSSNNGGTAAQPAATAGVNFDEL